MAAPSTQQEQNWGAGRGKRTIEGVGVVINWVMGLLGAQEVLD